MASIELKGKHSNGNSLIVDDEDVDFMNKFNWFVAVHKNKRVVDISANIKPSHMLMGKPPKGYVWDHKNRNPLDCRKDNLRLATFLENGRNKRHLDFSTSKYKGVHLNKRTNRYYSGIKYFCHKIYLGAYESEVLAAQAYNTAAEALFGEFCNLNRVSFPNKELVMKVGDYLLKADSKPYFNGIVINNLIESLGRCITGELTPSWEKPLI